MEECKKKEFEEMNILYKEHIENIRYSKKQQWQTAYYGLLLQAGILGYFNLYTQYSCLLILFSFASFLFITYLLFVYQWDLGRYRSITAEIEGKMEIYKGLLEKHKVVNFISKYSVLVIFVIIQLAATILVISTICSFVNLSG